MHSKFKAVELALASLKAGKMVLLTDDSHRENEADLIFAAEHITEDAMRFMLKHTCGIVCLAITNPQAAQLGLKLLFNKSDNANHQKTPFAMSFEASQGVTTGISVGDRVTTILAAMKEGAAPSDIVSPGHVFPLIAEEAGVLTRRGHTEGSVDLMKLAHLKPASVICELMNPDSSVAKGAQVLQFAGAHDIPLVSVQDIVQYRKAHENHVALYSKAKIPTQDYGDLILSVFENPLQEQEIVVLHAPSFQPSKETLVRVHSACFTGDLLGSTRCDCGEQLERSLKKILAENGVLIYLPQEGRGIGLGNKIKAYALQAEGMDTVEANDALGFKADERDYAAAAQILKTLGCPRVKLLTNNPLKVQGLSSYGIDVCEQVPLEVVPNPHNVCYLDTKKNKLNHLLRL
jgi:3,4-dihydroxy 2-butanone 4-phosphate synthase/GTP cyclohydrolase II